MPGTKKPRKAYKPRTPAGFMRLPSTIRYSQSNETQLQLVPHAELEKFRRGLADEYSWNTLAFRLNWGFVMADDFMEAEARAVMEQGLAAIRSVKARHERLGQWGMAGEEFTQVGDALNLTDQMQQRTTRKEQHAAIEKVVLVNEYKHKEQLT
jgi:hypothetical protein